MIRCENGKVELKGSTVDISADLSSIINTFEKHLIDKGYSKEDADKRIEESVRIGLLSDEELDKETGEVIEKLAGEFAKVLGAMTFGGLFK